MNAAGINVGKLLRRCVDKNGMLSLVDYQLDDTSVRRDFSRLSKRVKGIDIRDNRGVTCSAMIWLALYFRTSSSLTQLRINGTRVRNQGLQSVASLESLTELWVDIASDKDLGITIEGLVASIPSMGNLEALYVPGLDSDSIKYLYEQCEEGSLTIYSTEQPPHQARALA